MTIVSEANYYCYKNTFVCVCVCFWSSGMTGAKLIYACHAALQGSKSRVHNVMEW